VGTTGTPKSRSSAAGFGLSVANDVGIRGLLVHAISEDAKQFYLKYGFQESPTEPMTLLLSIKNITQHLS
jgi:hypothetical protein